VTFAGKLLLKIEITPEAKKILFGADSK